MLFWLIKIEIHLKALFPTLVDGEKLLSCGIPLRIHIYVYMSTYIYSL